VGKTTSESVLEFPKSEIQDVRAEILEQNEYGIDYELRNDVISISLERKGVVFNYTNSSGVITIHFNDGMTEYNEIVRP
jgi:frataxin-like iron-binding protein CyaY